MGSRSTGHAKRRDGNRIGCPPLPHPWERRTLHRVGLARGAAGNRLWAPGHDEPCPIFALCNYQVKTFNLQNAQCVRITFFCILRSWSEFHRKISSAPGASIVDDAGKARRGRGHHRRGDQPARIGRSRPVRTNGCVNWPRCSAPGRVTSWRSIPPMCRPTSSTSGADIPEERRQQARSVLATFRAQDEAEEPTPKVVETLASRRPKLKTVGQPAQEQRRRPGAKGD